MILNAVLALDLATAVDVATTYIESHDKVCEHNGTCPPPPQIVQVAITMCAMGADLNLFPYSIGLG